MFELNEIKWNAVNDCELYVDVEPEVVLLADISDLVDGIERTEDGGTSRGVDQERDFTIGDALLDESLQFGRQHLAPNPMQLNLSQTSNQHREPALSYPTTTRTKSKLLYSFIN